MMFLLCRYFFLNRTGSEVSQQRGVFRVNCIDCLDRTNVVEGLLAKRSLRQQLIRLGVLTEADNIETQPAFDYVFRNGKLYLQFYYMRLYYLQLYYLQLYYLQLYYLRFYYLHLFCR